MRPAAGGEPQSHPDKTIRLWAGLHFYSCFCRNINWTVSCCDCGKPQEQLAPASSLWCSLIEECFKKRNFQLPDTPQSLLSLFYSAINQIVLVS